MVVSVWTGCFRILGVLFRVEEAKQQRVSKAISSRLRFAQASLLPVQVLSFIMLIFEVVCEGHYEAMTIAI